MANTTKHIRDVIRRPWVWCVIIVFVVVAIIIVVANAQQVTSNRSHTRPIETTKDIDTALVGRIYDYLANQRAKLDENIEQKPSYRIGDIYDDGAKSGVVFEVWNQGRSGKIVALYNAHRYWDNSTRPASVAFPFSLNDGWANTLAIASVYKNEENPVIDWCNSLGEGWYLPSIEELKSIYANIDIINTSLGSNRDLEWGWYWSSTEYNNISVRRVHIYQGVESICHKGMYGYISAVAQF